MLLFGDIHGEHEINNFTKIYKANNTVFFGKNIHFMGDWGFLWSVPQNKSEKYWIDWFSEKPNIFIITPGNHDNWDLILALPIVEIFGGKMYKLTNNIYFTMRGEIYDIENKKIWCFGGAQSIDKAHRIAGKSWWEQEVPTHSEMQHGIDNLEKNNWEVDYVLTHTLPRTVIHSIVNPVKEEDPTANYFEFILNNGLKFKDWYAGHFHEDITIHNKFHILHKTIGII